MVQALCRSARGGGVRGGGHALGGRVVVSARSARERGKSRAEGVCCSIYVSVERRMSAAASMCPHTTLYVSAYYYICVRILLYVPSCYVSLDYYICVLMLLRMCPHTTIYASAYYYMCPHTAMCPHTNIHVSSYILLCMSIYVSAYYNVCVLISYVCVLILLHMCPHTTIYMSSYCYMCVLILL
jgi:hypothetical protein